MLLEVSRPFPPPIKLPPEGVIVRTYEARDVAALFALFNSEQCQSDFLPEPFPTEAAVAEWLEARRVGNYQVVATLDDDVVGFAGLYPLRGRQNHTGFTCVAVREDVQGRGFGRILFQALIATADQLAGLVRLELSVIVENTRAIALYRSCGFAIEGRHRCFAQRGDGFVDGFTMARFAGAQASAEQQPGVQRAAAAS